MCCCDSFLPGFPFGELHSVPGSKEIKYIEVSNGLLDAALRTAEFTKLSKVSIKNAKFCIKNTTICIKNIVLENTTFFARLFVGTP
jgi:hypothetical protein